MDHSSCSELSILAATIKFMSKQVKTYKKTAILVAVVLRSTVIGDESVNKQACHQAIKTELVDLFTSLHTQ